MAKQKKEKVSQEVAKMMQRLEFAEILTPIENYPFISDPGKFKRFKNKRKTDFEPPFEMKPLLKQIRYWPSEMIEAFIRVQGQFDGQERNTPAMVAIFETLFQNSHEGRERHRLLRYVDDCL